MTTQTFNHRFLPHAITVLCALLLGTLAVVWNFPCPQVDDAFYKSPAAELVQHGRLAIPCSAGFLPRMEEVFACYPPFYQLTLAIWYAVFGVTLKSSLAFSFFVHAVNSLMIVELSRRWLREHGGLSAMLKIVLPTIAGVVHLCNLAFFDRQEELALVFVFSSMLIAWAPISGLSVTRQMLLGICVGCAALTSPWAGMLVVVMTSARELLNAMQGTTHLLGARWAFSFVRLAIIGTIVVAMISAWFLSIEFFYPGVIREQFLGILKHLSVTQNRDGVWQRMRALYVSVFYSPGQMPATCVVMGGMFVLVAKRGWRKLSPNFGAIFVTVIVGTFLLAWKRPEAYTYFSAIQILSLSCFAAIVSGLFMEREETTTRLSLVGKLVAVTCVIVAARDTATHAYFAWQLPHQERAPEVYARLRERIPVNASVAVAARHWLAFQGRNPWRESFFSSLESPAEILKCDWLVMEPDRGRPYFLDDFELVEEVIPTTVADHSYAFSLYRRRPDSQRSAPTRTIPSSGPEITLTRESPSR